MPYEADPHHVEKLLRDMGMEDCKTLTVPGIKAATGSVALELPEEDQLGAVVRLRDPSVLENRVWNLQSEIAYIKSKMGQPLSKDLRRLLDKCVLEARGPPGSNLQPGPTQ